MTKTTKDVAQASPTKQFFVSMLTRDISLADAILDLVDNCLDGALRLAKGDAVNYARHFVKIELAADHFSIEDNCGGIPRDVAKNYAFKMGREPDDDRDSDTETIGMYGVGMKRALFKMGDHVGMARGQGLGPAPDQRADHRQREARRAGDDHPRQGPVRRRLEALRQRGVRERGADRHLGALHDVPSVGPQARAQR